jgi:hypothetical protein
MLLLVVLKNYDANLRTVKATEELHGTLFDIMA